MNNWVFRREQLGIPTVYGTSDTIHADKLILEYFLGKAYVLSWQGKGIHGQSINIDSPPLSHEAKANIYTRKRPLWFNLLWLSIFPPFAYILHSIIIISLIQRYKKRLKTQIENH